MDNVPTIHLVIKGKVQGVFYRASAKEVADSLHLNGWVKNTKEGNVECVVSGDETAVFQFISWCKQGPDHARVEEVIVSETAISINEGFCIIR